MRLHRLFGRWKLKGHDGTEQDTPYMDGLWRKVFQAVAKRRPSVRRCLVLGVAMGSSFDLIRSRWPDAAIVGVDWEPALFALGQELHVFRPNDRVRFIEGDARAVMPTLDGTFDLALIDLFFGRKVADAVTDPGLQNAIASRLESGGAVCVNYFDQPSVLAGWRAKLGEPETVHYQGNRIAIFRRERDNRPQTKDKR